jgi:glutathione S-transferase
MGETVSLVDIAIMPFFERMSVALATWKDFEIANPARLPLAPPEGRTHLNTWFEVMTNRDSYRQTRMSPERIIELYSRFLNLDYFFRVGVTQ